MTASLYQSAASGSAGAASGSVRAFLGSRNTEHVRGQGLRVELDEIAPAAPAIAARRHQVLQRIERGRRAIEVDPARLLHARVEVHRHQDEIRFFLLAENEKLVVVDRMDCLLYTSPSPRD